MNKDPLNDFYSHPLWVKGQKELLSTFSKNKNCLFDRITHNGMKGALLSFFHETKTPLLYITASNSKADRLHRTLSFFFKEPILKIPAGDTSLLEEERNLDPDLKGEKNKALQNLLEEKPRIIITPLQTLLEKFQGLNTLLNSKFTFKRGETYPFEAFLKQIESLGYLKTPVVSEKGEFAIRGGIVDIYPISSLTPYRIEFFGDEIDSIRSFDPSTQRSIQKEDRIEIFSSKEPAYEDLSETFFSLIPPDTVLILDDILELEDSLLSLKSLRVFDRPQYIQESFFYKKLETHPLLFFTHKSIFELSELSKNSLSKKTGSFIFEAFNFSFEAVFGFNPFFEGEFFAEETHSFYQTATKLLEKKEAFFLFSSEKELKALHKLSQEQNISLDETRILPGYLEGPLFFLEPFFSFFPLSLLTGNFSIQREKKRTFFEAPLSDFHDLLVGDLVVHFQQGIGRFLGIEKKKDLQGEETEYFCLEYAEKSKLFVPLNHAYLLTKYIGIEENNPELHLLGSNKWKKAKEDTEKAILVYAKEILKLEAERKLKGGFSCPPDSPLLEEFEEEFPYEPTLDQKNAILDIKKDMQSNEAMERLICGDVGYGKTEVAMRAAFKAVADGKKQVAFLVPTTVLAMQHFETMQERMQNFPISIAALSRFEKPSEIKKTLENLRTGKIDIVVGTHRLLSKEVSFKDLGLVIIDEEQRFGVKAKEHLKLLKTGVDCLTLSATPIPRTLYFSLVGAREISVISTPPQDRIPISTFLCEGKDDVIQNALLRELSRGGQSFFIHNRVETIYKVKEKLQKLVPQAKIVVAHGQMDSQAIEDVFHLFKSGEAHILLATTIIESGIDIPNANTILIDRADLFGLSDLYQLRGRVGRWNIKAYAYFLVPNIKILPELARKRLSALLQTSGFGGGMKIALRDLEIRGSGNILGYEQSGHISSIGFHFYCKLLTRTIKALQGFKTINLIDFKLNAPFHGKLPASYVTEASLRMELYQRIGEIYTLSELDALFEEIVDRFGMLPKEGETLYRLTKMKIMAALKGFSSLTIQAPIVTLERSEGDKMKLYKMLIKKETPLLKLEELLTLFLEKH